MLRIDTHRPGIGMKRICKGLIVAGAIFAIGAHDASCKPYAAHVFPRAEVLYDTTHETGQKAKIGGKARETGATSPAGMDRYGRAMKTLSALKRVFSECTRRKITVFDSISIARKWVSGFLLARDDLAAYLKTHPHSARKKRACKNRGNAGGHPDCTPECRAEADRHCRHG
jgi:hypothetical protein